MRQSSPTQTVLDEASTTKVGSSFYVRDYRNIVMFTATNADSGNASLTVKVRGSIQEKKPDFSSTANKDNLYEGLEFKDLADSGTALDDATGYAATANEVRAFEINTNGMDWVVAEVTAYTSGRVSVFMKAYDNG